MFYENESKSKKNYQTFSPPLSPSYSQMAITEGANSEIFVIIREEDFNLQNNVKRRFLFWS